jgi:hypothetical protein
VTDPRLSIGVRGLGDKHLSGIFHWPHSIYPVPQVPMSPSSVCGLPSKF